MQAVSNSVAQVRGNSTGAAMKKVAVFASESRSNALHKESLIYDSIDSALKTMPDVAWERRDLSGLADSPSRPGLSEVRSHEKIVALGGPPTPSSPTIASRPWSPAATPSSWRRTSSASSGPA